MNGSKCSTQDMIGVELLCSSDLVLLHQRQILGKAKGFMTFDEFEKVITIVIDLD